MNEADPRFCTNHSCQLKGTCQRYIGQANVDHLTDVDTNAFMPIEDAVNESYYCDYYLPPKEY